MTLCTNTEKKSRPGRLSVGGLSLPSTEKKRRRKRGLDGVLLPLSPDAAKTPATTPKRGRGGSVARVKPAATTPATPVVKRKYKTRAPKVKPVVAVPSPGEDDADLMLDEPYGQEDYEEAGDGGDGGGKKGSAVDALSRFQVRTHCDGCVAE